MNKSSIKWWSVSEYADKMSKVKSYIAIPKNGGIEIISGNVSKEWLIENFVAICPVPTEGMKQFKRDIFNYGESEMVPASTLTVGDKIYYDYYTLTVTEVDGNGIKTDLQNFIINPSVMVERL